MQLTVAFCKFANAS